MFICTGEIKFLGVDPVLVGLRVVVVDSPHIFGQVVGADVLAGAWVPVHARVVLVLHLALVLWVDLHQEGQAVQNLPTAHEGQDQAHGSVPLQL